MIRIAIALLVLCSCTVVGWVEDGGKKIGGEIGGHVAEWIACPTDLINCGHVYQCDTPADTPSGLVEICIDDDATQSPADYEDINGTTCELTPRHEGLCIWCCGPDCGSGCNAFSGCWCP